MYYQIFVPVNQMSILSQKSKAAINLISNHLDRRKDTYNIHFFFYVVETNYLYKSSANQVFVLYHIYNHIIIIITYLLLIYIIILIIISTEIYMLREFKL